MNGIKAEYLQNWRGQATILPPRLTYEKRPRYGPTAEWCGIPVTRLWRCGNRGNVASVLIEKPTRGDFLPIVDGGFSLRYSPLMEYREGKGIILFCQMDVTGRTENDPATQAFIRNIFQYVSWRGRPGLVISKNEGKMPSPRQVIYVGEPDGKQHLESMGIALTPYDAGSLSNDDILVVRPGGQYKLSPDAATISEWLKTGGHLLAVGLDEQQLNAFLPMKVHMKEAEHISSYFEPFDVNSPFVGIGPADVHSREPRILPLLTSKVTIIDDGVLARAKHFNIVFCQLVPWQFSKETQNVKRTFRRTSYLLARLLANMGAAGSAPILERFESPTDSSNNEKRWLEGLYLDTPEEWDDPYRFFRW
jgi:hypothetical protein